MFHSHVWLMENGKYSRSLGCWRQNTDSAKNKLSFKENSLKGEKRGADLWLYLVFKGNFPSVPGSSRLGSKSLLNGLLCWKWRQSSLSVGLLCCWWSVIFPFTLLRSFVGPLWSPRVSALSRRIIIHRWPQHRLLVFRERLAVSCALKAESGVFCWRRASERTALWPPRCRLRSFRRHPELH